MWKEMFECALHSQNTGYWEIINWKDFLLQSSLFVLSFENLKISTSYHTLIIHQLWNFVWFLSMTCLTFPVILALTQIKFLSTHMKNSFNFPFTWAFQYEKFFSSNNFLFHLPFNVNIARSYYVVKREKRSLSLWWV